MAKFIKFKSPSSIKPSEIRTKLINVEKISIVKVVDDAKIPTLELKLSASYVLVYCTLEDFMNAVLEFDMSGGPKCFNTVKDPDNLEKVLSEMKGKGSKKPLKLDPEEDED